MSAVLTDPPMTIGDYLVWEADQTERHEFLAGEVHAMTGARVTHNSIALNVAFALRQALHGTQCRVFMSDVKVAVAAANAAFYPDVLVSCDPRDRTPEAELAQRHPKLIVEVLSDSTAGYDRGRKFEAYRTLESLEAYLLVEQDRVHADLFVRNEQGLWVMNPAAEGGQLTIPSFDLVLPIASVYEGIAFTGMPAAVDATPPF